MDPKYPVPDHEAGGVRRPHQVHGLARPAERRRAGTLPCSYPTHRERAPPRRRSATRSSESRALRDRISSMPDPSFVFAQSLSGLTAAMFLFLIASGLSLIFGVLRVLNFAHGTFYMLGAYSAFQLVQWIGTGPGSFWLAALGAALAVALAGRHRRALPLPAPLRQGGALPAPLHLRPGADPERRGQDHLGHPAEVGEPAARSSPAPSRVFGATIPHYNLFILLLGPAHRARLLVRAPAHARRALHPGRRARPRDAGRARGERRRALHRRVRARLVPGRARRRPHHPDARDRAGHGHRDHRGGVRGGGHRRARLLLGHVPRRGDLRPGALLRHPVLPALLDLRGLRPHGRRAHHPPLGPPGPARSSNHAPRIPWALLVLVAAFFVPAARLALLHVPGQRRGDLGAVRHEPQPAGGLHRARLLRPRGLLRDRRLHHRHPDEEAGRDRSCSRSPPPGSWPGSSRWSSASSACASPASTSRCSPSPSPRSCGRSASSGTR